MSRTERVKSEETVWMVVEKRKEEAETCVRQWRLVLDPRDVL